MANKSAAECRNCAPSEPVGAKKTECLAVYEICRLETVAVLTNFFPKMLADVFGCQKQQIRPFRKP